MRTVPFVLHRDVLEAESPGEDFAAADGLAVGGSFDDEGGAFDETYLVLDEIDKDVAQPVLLDSCIIIADYIRQCLAQLGKQW